jgi:leader peptidase (prepilin peptidase)/N-methyltransferase
MSPLLILLTFAVTVPSALVTEFVMLKRWVPRWRERHIVLSEHPLLGRTARLVVSIILGSVTAVGYANLWAAPAFAVAAWTALLSIGTDLTTTRIPREASWFTLLVALGSLAVSTAVTGSYAGAASAGLALAGLTFMMVLTAFLTAGGLGSGDVRLVIALAPLAGWVGYSALLIGVGLGCVVQILLRPFIKVRHDENGKKIGYPFAPALMVGLLIAIAIFGAPGTPAIEWFGILS